MNNINSYLDYLFEMERSPEVVLDLLRKRDDIIDQMEKLNQEINSKADNSSLNDKILFLNNALHDINERINHAQIYGKDPGPFSQSFSFKSGLKNSDKYIEHISKELISHGIMHPESVKNFLLKIPGAQQLTKKMNIKPLMVSAGILGMGALLAALFSYSSYKLYVAYSSEGWNKCKHVKSFKERYICTKKYELKGINERINDLNNSLKYCDNLKSESKSCRENIKKEIEFLRREQLTIKEFLNKNNISYNKL